LTHLSPSYNNTAHERVNRGAEFAAQENEGQRNFRGWKMQDWKLTDKSAAGKNVGHT